MCRCEMFATNHEPMACLENKTLNLKRKAFILICAKFQFN